MARFTKEQLIKRTLKFLFDESAEDPNEFLYIDPITMNEAKLYLNEGIALEKSMGLEADERLLDDVTPEIYMEAWNCHLRAMKHEAQISNLADWITNNECVCEYDDYCADYMENPIYVLPVQFLCDDVSEFPFPLPDGEHLDPYFLIALGKRSAKTFDPDDEYCWYDKEDNRLYSTNFPFHDGTIDPKAFARFILEDKDALTYFIKCLIPDDELTDIFGSETEALINE